MKRNRAKLQAKIVVIGGGTGSFVVLSGLKHYADNITALVNMSDDGGSTGQLRDELGVLPPGDVRQCLVALSDSPRLRDLFNYRFEEGSLRGHAFGNLFLTAIEKMTGNFGEAVAVASDVLRICGTVEPMTLDSVTLVMRDAAGNEVMRGQHRIGYADFHDNRRPTLLLDPPATINPRAQKAIAEADLIVLSPGNLYGSLAPVLIIDGVSEALQAARAKVVYVSNLVTVPGQTDGFKVADFVAEIERFMSGRTIDYVIYNNVPPSDEQLERYAHTGEYPVAWDETVFKQAAYRALGRDLVSRTAPVAPSTGDPIAGTRTLIRHDSRRVAREIIRTYYL